VYITKNHVFGSSENNVEDEPRFLLFLTGSLRCHTPVCASV